MTALSKGIIKSYENHMFGRVGISNIPANANEDRYCTYTSANNSLVAFGVFDGHGGSYGSTLCSRVFCQSVLTIFDQMVIQLSSNSEIVDQLGEDVYDALLCEAIRRTSEITCQNIKHMSSSGTTSTALFVRRLPSGKLRVYCSNTGDSRAVWFKSQSLVVCMSDDHTLKSPKEIERINGNFPIQFLQLPMDPLTLESNMKIAQLPKQDENSCPEGCLRTIENVFKNFDNVDFTFIGAAAADALPSIPMKQTIPPSPKVLASGKYMDHPRPLGSDLEGFPISETSRPEAEAELVHQNSFIAPRVSSNSPEKMGPLALFGRYGTSILMTRSLGDKYGARSCVNCPEITSVDIASTERARFVLGSDGMWDVMTPKEALRKASGVRDPLKAAEGLAVHARASRRARRMRMDDITCLVIDLWPQSERESAHGDAFAPPTATPQLFPPHFAPPLPPLQGGCGCTIS